MNSNHLKLKKMKKSKNKFNLKNFSKSYLSIINLILTTAVLFCFFNSETVKASDKKIISSEYLKKGDLYDYILGEGDVLIISISDQIPELTKIYQIDSSGTIYFPKLNRIYVSGLTIFFVLSCISFSISNKVFSKTLCLLTISL